MQLRRRQFRRGRRPGPRAARQHLAALLAAALLVTLPGLATAAPGASGDDGSPAAGKPSTVSSVASEKGPVGWDTYRKLDGMDQLRRGGQIRQSSSYDRSGGNDDGFVGTYSCLRESGDGCVIAESEGAGELQSIWFTRLSNDVPGDVSDTGNITIELDGETVLEGNLQDIVSGKKGAPFSWPLVGNNFDTSGGAVIKVPMPYRESMKVTVEKNPLFHHVTYRSFADADGVERFDPSDKAEDVLRTMRAFGTADPKPRAEGAGTARKELDVPAGGSATLARLRGPGEISQLRVRLPQVLRSPRYRDDGRAFGEGGGSTFRMAVDPDNEGVRLTRRYDPVIGGQTSRVLVDGKEAGQWKTGEAQPEGRWADQTLEIPAALTKGKDRITVKHEFVSSERDVNEFRYDAASRVGGDWTRTDVLDLGEGRPGEEESHGYRISGETWKGPRDGRYPLTDKEKKQLTASDELLADARLRVTFDGRRTVDAPLGEFFGSGLGEYDVRTLMFSMDTAPDGWYTAWWPMPYAKSAVVELVNSSVQKIEGGTAEVTHAPDASAPERLDPQGGSGYFHATGKRKETTDGRDWSFLETGGRGVYYGATHSMRGLITSGNRRNYLEGDERVYVDGGLSPAMYGTGSEDYYESGWYFMGGTTFSMPVAGNPAYELDGDGCKYDCTGTYRLQIGDAVSFGSGLKFGMEHGPASNEPGDYSSTAYWYGQETAAARQSDTVDVTDPESREAHGYRAEGESEASLTSTFEGDDDDVSYTSGVTAAEGAVSFRVAADGDNSGVRLRRLGDQKEGYQRAAVSVNGKPAGVWSTTRGNGTSRWLEDTFEIPAALAEGRSELEITLTPEDGSPAWSAARYDVASHVPPFADGAAPEQVGGVRAAGDGTNAVDVQWSPARDDVGAAAYEVYASKDPSVPVNSRTLLGETRHLAFRHSGLGLEEKWHYRVRAVDAAGHKGKASAVASGTSGNALVHEAEDLLPPVSADAPVEAQANCCGVVWSGDAQLWFRATKADQQVTVEFSVPRDGTYDLATVLTKAPDYGNAAFGVDGEALGDAFRGYDPKVGKTDWVDLGNRKLAKGKHRLTLTVTGKDADATGYLAGLDAIRTTRTG
ncbi:DUF2961 domain-containing protein [Streptomyces armeniacus]|uniref:DUF2961 domain-containing protein n=1 Tax=Streptomyces armeniacus TaxID=83291 RepID=UPI001AD82105|nr:DUF2961 domain-containing protein [Streptomyces armeniacus]